MFAIFYQLLANNHLDKVWKLAKITWNTNNKPHNINDKITWVVEMRLIQLNLKANRDYYKLIENK